MGHSLGSLYGVYSDFVVVHVVFDVCYSVTIELQDAEIDMSTMVKGILLRVIDRGLWINGCCPFMPIA